MPPDRYLYALLIALKRIPGIRVNFSSSLPGSSSLTYLRNSVGQKPLSHKVQPLPWGDSVSQLYAQQYSSSPAYMRMRVGVCRTHCSTPQAIHSTRRNRSPELQPERTHVSFTLTVASYSYYYLYCFCMCSYNTIEGLLSVPLRALFNPNLRLLRVDIPSFSLPATLR